MKTIVFMVAVLFFTWILHLVEPIVINFLCAEILKCEGTK